MLRDWLDNLKDVDPVIAKKAWNTPQHAQRFNGARGFRFAHVRFFPAELIEDLADNFFRLFVVAANEHGGCAALKLRIDHARGAN